MSRYPFEAIRGPGQPGYSGHSKGLAQAVDFRTPGGTELYLPPGSWRCSVSQSLRGSYGRWVEVKGPTTLRFAHLSRRDLVAGRTYPGGTLLGLTGNTGNSTGPHLHFEADADIWAWGEQIWEADMLTKDDIRDLLETEIGQAFKMLGKKLDGLAQDATGDPKRILAAMAKAYTAVGNVEIAEGKD